MFEAVGNEGKGLGMELVKGLPANSGGADTVDVVVTINDDGSLFFDIFVN